jgi:hypothetical protein
VSVVGKNTPHSVLSHIDAVWRKHAEPDPLELARELRIGPTRYRRLREKHGDGLVKHLLELKRQRTEFPLFMAKQNGMRHPPQYVSSAEGAIDEAEVVPLNYQTVLVVDAKERFAKHRQANHAEEQAREDVKRLNARLKAVAIQSVRMGVSPVHVLAAIERQIAELEAETRKAA